MEEEQVPHKLNRYHTSLHVYNYDSTINKVLGISFHNHMHTDSKIEDEEKEEGGGVLQGRSETTCMLIVDYENKDYIMCSQVAPVVLSSAIFYHFHNFSQVFYFFKYPSFHIVKWVIVSAKFVEYQYFFVRRNYFCSFLLNFQPNRYFS